MKNIKIKIPRSGDKVRQHGLAGFGSRSGERETARPPEYNRMTKSVHHIGDDERPGSQIEFPAKASFVRSKRGAKRLLKSDLEVDRAISAVRHL